MKFSLGMAALVALGVTLAGPALAQTRFPQLPPEAAAAYRDVKAKCHDLAEPYLGGMLNGKITLDDENITQAMLANDSYPTGAEAVVLRGYVEALDKCEALQYAFLQKYAPWDLANADFIAQNERPVFVDLMNRKITYGLANRRLYDVAATASARRKASWPKVASQQAQDQREAPAKAALNEVGRKCLDLLAPFRNGILDGKTPIDAAPITPAMLAYNVVPDDAEAVALGNLITVRQQCWSLLQRFAQTYYRPPYLSVYSALAESERAILSTLAAKQTTFAEANRKLAALKQEGGARIKALDQQTIRQQAEGGAGVPSEQDVAGALH